jgi:tripartite-type tricarboxylate transporter receptor subunit TctC
MATALKDPAVKGAFEKAGAVPMAMTVDEAKKFQHEEIAKYRDIIAKAGIKQIE